MNTRNAPHLVTGEDVLPADHVLPPLEDVLVDAGQAAAQCEGPPLAVADDLELHAAADGLGDAVGAAQGLHAEGLLGGLPALEAGLEGVRRGGLVGGGVEGGLGDAVAEGVVDARGGGRRGGAVRVAEGGGLAVLWYDSEGL